MHQHYSSYIPEVQVQFRAQRKFGNVLSLCIWEGRKTDLVNSSCSLVWEEEGSRSREAPFALWIFLIHFILTLSHWFEVHMVVKETQALKNQSLIKDTTVVHAGDWNTKQRGRYLWSKQNLQCILTHSHLWVSFGFYGFKWWDTYKWKMNWGTWNAEVSVYCISNSSQYSS